ncbi:MAG: hypothetical protein AABW92_04760 [Nanoarchaeota archaeon]
MIALMDNTEADIPIFNKSVIKFSKCKHGTHFNGQKSCSVFHYVFDNSMDILYHCASCKLDISEPTTKKLNVRVY